MPTDKTTELTVETCLAELREMLPTMQFHFDIVSGPEMSYCNLTILDRPPSTHVMYCETSDTFNDAMAQIRAWTQQQ